MKYSHCTWKLWETLDDVIYLKRPFPSFSGRQPECWEIVSIQVTWGWFSATIRIELYLLLYKITSLLPRDSLLKTWDITKASPFGIFFTPIFVSPTKKWDYWSICLIFIFCLVLSLLPCVAYKSANTQRGNNLLFFYHFQNISLYLNYLQNLNS